MIFLTQKYDYVKTVMIIREIYMKMLFDIIESQLIRCMSSNIGNY